MKNGLKALFFKFVTILKWFLWLAGVVFLVLTEQLYFLAALATAAASGFLIKKYVRRVPVFLIPAVCLLAGNMFMLLLKSSVIPEAVILLVVDIVIAVILLFRVMRKPSKPGIILLFVFVLFALFLDFRLFDAFDHTGKVNSMGFDQIIIKFFLLGFLIPAFGKLRRAYREANQKQGGRR